MSANVNLVESFLQKNFFNVGNLENYIFDQLESIKNSEEVYEKKVIMTGRSDGASSRDFGDYLIDTTFDSNLDNKWQEYISKL